MVNHDDDALARLRASDPATGSHPDLHSLRQRIAHKAPASQGADTATRLHDDIFRGPGLRAPWIAAAAVAAFGFGAGGYAIGAQQAPDTGGRQLLAGQGDEQSDAADGGDPADGGAAGDSGEALASPGLTTDEEASGQSSSASMGGDSGASGAWDPGPVRLTAGPDLPSERGTGEVRALTSDEDPAEFLDAWAAELAFEGIRPAVDEDSMFGWYGENALYDVDNGRMLTVTRDGGSGLSFNYEDMLGSPWCADSYSGIPEEEMATIVEEWTKAFGEGVPFPDASRCKDVSGEAPSADEAIATARDFLATTGLDLSGYTLQVPDFHDETINQVMVEGWPEGQQNGHIVLSAQVGPEGVTSAYGTIGEMTSLGEYPLISAVEAVERYGDRVFGMEYGITLTEDMVPAGTEAEILPEETAVELPEATPIEPGMKIPLLLKDKVVTGAELTTGTMWGQASGPLEVPTWKLTTGDGMEYAVLALADEAIDWQSWGE